jgi:hypothetical protein
MGIFKSRGRSGGSAPAGNYYGGNGRYGAGPDDRSLFAAGRSLAHAPEAFEDFARMLDAWAREFEEDQPADLSIPEQIRAAIGVVRSLGADSGDWQANYRRRHEADEQRLESPARGSRTVEAKRDVRAAHNEGL